MASPGGLPDRHDGVTGRARAGYPWRLHMTRLVQSARPRASRAPLALAFVIALGALVAPAGHDTRHAQAATLAALTAAEAADLSPSAAEAALVGMINADRAAAGLRPLRLDPRLSAIARERSASMAAAGELSHVQADGRTMVDLITAGDIAWYAAGETIGWNDYPGLADSTRVVNQGWMDSPEHTAIIRSTDYNYFGLGLGTSAAGDRYWTALFLRGPDHTAPWATMSVPTTGSSTTLASTHHALRVTWSWAGGDRPLAALTSGLQSFDVQRRVDGGAWVAVLTSTTSRAWSSSVSIGHRVAVRVRARDRAGNVGSWSPPVSVSA